MLLCSYGWAWCHPIRKGVICILLTDTLPSRSKKTVLVDPAPLNVKDTTSKILVTRCNRWHSMSINHKTTLSLTNVNKKSIVIKPPLIQVTKTNYISRWCPVHTKLYDPPPPPPPPTHTHTTTMYSGGRNILRHQHITAGDELFSRCDKRMINGVQSVVRMFTPFES